MYTVARSPLTEKERGENDESGEMGISDYSHVVSLSPYSDPDGIFLQRRQIDVWLDRFFFEVVQGNAR